MKKKEKWFVLFVVIILIVIIAFSFFGRTWGDSFSGDLSNWTIVDGNWHIEDGMLCVDEEGSSRKDILFNVPSELGDNYEVSCKVQVVCSTVDRPEGQMVVRWVDEGDYYFVGLGAYGYKGAIGAFIDCCSSLLVSSGGDSTYADVEMGRWYTQKVKVEGNQITLYIDGVEVCSLVDSVHSIGQVGLSAIYSTVYFDDFRVRAL